MNKLLTISIAAYNVEAYIKKTLNSIARSRYLDLIEVFIVDDGGSDNTLNIAKEFQREHPETFIPVHKENGGYGTTINYSIEHASGKYFKVLDGDDWFDTDGLDELIEVLQASNEDVIVSNYFIWLGDVKCITVFTHDDPEGTVVNLSSGFTTDRSYGMWEVVFKLDLLRKCHLTLPAHTLYTDRHYSTIPFAYADTIKFTDAKVYCYRLGRDGQSMTPESQVKHYKERFDGSIELCKFYAEQKKKGNPRCKYLISKIAASHSSTASVVRFMPKSKESLDILKKYENTIKRISKEIVSQEAKYGGQFGLFLTLCRLTGYMTYWLTPDVVLKKK